jgi:hypothetical protein
MDKVATKVAGKLRSELGICDPNYCFLWRLLKHAWQSPVELPAVGRKQKDHIGFGDIAALLLDADLVVHNGGCTYHGEAALAFDLQSISSMAPTILHPNNRLTVMADQNY